MLDSEYIVIGSGVTGLCIAWSVAKLGRSVCVVHAPGAMPRASRAAAGMLAPSFEQYPETEVGRAAKSFAYDALDRWGAFTADLEGLTGKNIDFQKNGILGVAQTRDGSENLKRITDTSTGHASPLTIDQIRRLEPRLSKEIISGIYAEGEGQVDPVQLLVALEQACLLANVHFIESSIAQVLPADAIGQDQRHGHDQREIQPVYLQAATGEGPFAKARQVILATGAMPLTNILSAWETFVPPTIRPIKGEALSFATKNEPSSPIVEHVIRSEGVYLCPKSDGRLIVGATEQPGRRDILPDVSATEELAVAARSLVPPLEMMEIQSQWAGIRPISTDGAPILGPALPYNAPGRHKGHGIHFALAAYRNGVLFGPHIGQLFAESLVNGSQSATEILAQFNAARFHP
ncbi:MAG: FAD-dependent oxidoreductase [Pseudomonadota bacterium]